MTNVEFIEQVVLRGLEGMIGDNFLERIITDDHHDEIESFENFQEAKHIAEQYYFKMKGWAL